MFNVVSKPNMTLNEPEMDYEFSHLACKFDSLFFQFEKACSLITSKLDFQGHW